MRSTPKIFCQRAIHLEISTRAKRLANTRPFAHPGPKVSLSCSLSKPSDKRRVYLSSCKIIKRHRARVLHNLCVELRAPDKQTKRMWAKVSFHYTFWRLLRAACPRHNSAARGWANLESRKGQRRFAIITARSLATWSLRSASPLNHTRAAAAAASRIYLCKIHTGRGENYFLPPQLSRKTQHNKSNNLHNVINPRSGVRTRSRFK
jgi:hypothetical protein